MIRKGVLLSSTKLKGPEQMAMDIKTKLEKIHEITHVDVDITFEPPWTPEMMTDKARTKLGFSKPKEPINTNWE